MNSLFLSDEVQRISKCIPNMRMYKQGQENSENNLQKVSPKIYILDTIVTSK